jgi:hypothetical protein
MRVSISSLYAIHQLSNFINCLEVVSKPQIRLKSKAQTDEKAQSAKALWRMSSTF